MTYSQINPTKVGGFLLLTALILLTGCSQAIEDLAWAFTDTSKTDAMTAQINQEIQCVNKCLEDGTYEREIDCIYYCNGCINCIEVSADSSQR